MSCLDAVRRYNIRPEETVVEIFYFSGTGNSLHVARELQLRFSDALLIPIASLVRKETFTSTADVVGLVFPIHALTIPWQVKRFLEKATFSPTSYKFAIATRICFATVFANIDRLLAKQNTSLDAHFCFEMPETYVPLFQTYSQEQFAHVEAQMLSHLEMISSTVANRGAYRPKDPYAWLLFSRIIYPLTTAWFQRVRFPNMERSFYADDNCNGCGICERICLSSRIRMESRRPVWQSDVHCSYCFACLHYCPAQAIQIAGRNTVTKGRYHHPAITINDIASQKRT